MRTIIVSLAGREYSIQQLPIRANRAWRERFEAPIDKLVGGLQDALLLSRKKFPNEDGLVSAVVDLLAARLGDLAEVMVGSIDMAVNAVFEYSPEIAADRERIEAEAFDDELLAAFLKVVQLAFPFGPLIGLLPSLGPGGATTLPSSPAPSGASGKTRSTRSKRRAS